MSQKNTHTVVGGKTNDKHPEYLEGVRYWQTVSDIAKAWKVANPDDRRSLDQIQDQIIQTNHIKDGQGRDCVGVKRKFAVIHPEQVLVLPAGNAIGEVRVVYEDCPEDKKRPKVDEPVRRNPRSARTNLPPVPEKTPYLYIPSVTAKEDYGNMISAAGFFQPWPPQRSRAVGTEDPAKLRDGALLPAYSQGAKVRVSGKEIEAGATGAKGTTYGGRAFRVELTDRDAAEHYIDTNGNWTDYNPRFKRKAEYDPVKVVDGDGNVFNTPVGTAMISRPAFDNAASRHQTNDHDTAHLRRTKHNYSAEDLGVMSFYSNAQQKYEQLATQLSTASNPEDAALIADKMMATNAQLALSPLSWSVDSRGVPVKSFETIGSEMDAVLASPALSEAARKGIAAKYAPTRASLGDPDKQWAELQKLGGLQGIYNPLVEMAREQVMRTDELNGRPVGKYLREGYWDAMGRERGRDYTKAEKVELTVQAGEAYARKIQSVGVRVPDQVIERVALVENDVFNAQRQSATAMEQARSEGLATIRNDPKLMDDYIRYSLENPGVLQAVSNRVYLSTIKSAKGNRATLDFTKDSDADRYANQFVDQLAGKEFKGNLNYNGGIPVLKDIVNQVSFGALHPWAGVNQDKGGFKFQQAALERFNNGTEEDRNQIRAAFGELIDRSQSAASKGVHDANADLVAVLDLRNAAYLNGGKGPETHQRLQAATGTLIRDNLVQRMNGLDQAGASAELRLEQLRAKGVAYNTTIDTSEVAAAAASGDVKALGEAFRANNNPTLFTQGDTDRNLALVAQGASPLGFSMVALKAGLEPATARKFDGYLQSIDNGDRNMSAYADLMKHHVKAYRAASGDSAALQAAQAAAESDLSAYFAKPNPTATKGSVRLPISTASRYLAEHVAKDSPVAASFSAAFHAELSGTTSTMTAREQMQLNARLAVAGSPAEQGNIIGEFTNGSTAAQPIVAGRQAASDVTAPGGAATNVSTNAGTSLLTVQTQAKLAAIAADPSIKAADKAGLVKAQLEAQVQAGGPALNADQTTALLATVNAGGANLPSVLAGFGANASTNAGTQVGTNASTNAGTNTSTNAGTNAGTNTSTNAGAGTPVNAGLVSAIASYNSGTAAEANAGTGEVNAGSPNAAIGAHNGISWVKTFQNLLIITPFLFPKNPLTIPGEVPGCTVAGRPCGIPGGPGLPGLPGTPPTPVPGR